MSPIDRRFQVPGVLVTIRGSSGCKIIGISPEGLMIENHGKTIVVPPDDSQIELQSGIDWDGWLERWPEGQSPSGEIKG